MSWNRTYRPRTIEQLHLSAVRDYFTALMRNGTFPQVFLFAGSKGTGKTSTARIIAALLNDQKNASVVRTIFFEKQKSNKPLKEPEPGGELADRIFAGDSYIVHELDAASNRGIDDVRALKERVHLPPQEGLMSVYILDEVHMLTTEAFNALLKLLEEPPSHVVFILATTELEKIPATITSRAQVVRFTKASIAELRTALTSITTAEQLKAEEGVVDAVAAHADGSFRDAVKLLEMIAQVGPLTLENAGQVLQLGAVQHAQKLLDYLLAKDAVSVVQAFMSLRSGKVDSKLLHTQLLTTLHEELLRGHGVLSGTAAIPTKAAQFLLKELADPQLSASTPIPLLLLELRFLDLIERSQKRTPPSEPSTPTAPPRQADPPAVKSAQPRSIAQPVRPNLDEAIQATPPDTVPTFTGKQGNGQLVYDNWSVVVAKASEQNFGLATLLKAARPAAAETGKLVLHVYYQFHKEQLMQPKFRTVIDTIFSEFAGGTVLLECQLVQEPSTAELTQPSTTADLQELAVSSLM